MLSLQLRSGQQAVPLAILMPVVGSATARRPRAIKTQLLHGLG